MKYVIGHKNPDTDSICSAIALAHFLEASPAKQGAINPETEFVLNYFGLSQPETLTSVAGCEVYLVDHAERVQAPDDLESSKLLGIIDHHKVGIHTAEPIIYICKPLGSTATILAELYFRSSLDYIGAKNREMSPKVAGILMSAILSDTLVFKSPTTTDIDRKLAAELAKISLVPDMLGYGIDLLKAKSNVSKMTAKEVLNLDYKEFCLQTSKVGIAQVELIDPSVIEFKKNEIQELMVEKMSNEELDLIIFIITDIIRGGSEVIACGNTEAFEKAFGMKLENGHVYIEGLISRKKQILPVLSKYYANGS